MGLFLNKVSPVFNEISCHSRSSGIFLTPSLEKRGRGDFMEKKGKMKEGFWTSRNDNKGKTVCKGIGSIYWKPKVLNNKDRWTDF